MIDINKLTARVLKELEGNGEKEKSREENLRKKLQQF
jgi:hypothetical protein